MSVLCIGVAQAQRYNHATLWSRVTLNKRLNPNWSVQGEYHWRRQNNFHTSKWNLLENPFLQAGRIILSYQRKDWTFQLNPNFFYAHPLLGKEADFTNPAGREWRLAAYAEWARVRTKVTLRLRGGYEYRFLERNAFEPTGRARFRIQGRYNVSERVRWVLSTEPLVNVGPNPAPVFFSQNQAYTGLDFDLIQPWLGAEIGYLYVLRKRQSGIEFDNEHALGLQLKIRL
ncbi:MAG: DUF2490 domain-containing protein [Cytophagaceae bacterium]|nr:DUF2490 domain-containing protein [Cytophagaceae bacterium]